MLVRWENASGVDAPAKHPRRLRFRELALPNSGKASGTSKNHSLFLSLGFPIARLLLAVALAFDLPFDRVVFQFAGVVAGELHAVAFTGDFEGDFAPFELAIFNGRFGV